MRTYLVLREDRKKREMLPQRELAKTAAKHKCATTGDVYEVWRLEFPKITKTVLMAIFNKTHYDLGRKKLCSFLPNTQKEDGTWTVSKVEER